MRTPRTVVSTSALTAVVLAVGLALPASAEDSATSTQPPGAATTAESPEQVIPDAVPVEAEEAVTGLSPEAEIPSGLEEDLGVPGGTSGQVDTSTAQTPGTATEPEPTDAGTDSVPDDPAVAEDGNRDAARSGGPVDDAVAVPDGLEITRASSLTESDVAVAGVTWQPSDDTADVDAYLRQRTGETWSDWQAMEVSSLEGGAAPGTTDGTEPMAVLDADEVEVALVAPSEVTISGAALSMWDPGTSPADDEAELDAAAGTVTTGGTALPTARLAPPTIYSRADWGADESKMFWTPVTGEVTGVVVHHTAGTNGYSAAAVPGIIRGIYHYHSQSRGWGDIGYNVLVDRFGRAWEGRTGGLTRGVTGAHASGYNGAMFGISVMGDYDKIAVPEAAFDTVARVTAWKFALHGVNAHGRTTVAGRTLDTVVGHRDVAQTACPGRFFYPRLGELENRIAGYQGSWSSDVPEVLDHDLTGDGVADVAFRSGNAVSLWSTKETSGTTRWSPTQKGHGWAAARTVAPGDWNRDGTDDLMLVDGAGKFWFYAGLGTGRFAGRVQIGHGWQAIDLIATGTDWNGDGRPDLLGRQKRDGGLFLYPGNGRGGFSSSRQIGFNWDGMNSITLVENFRSGKAAVLARESSNGRLHAYVADGTGGFSTHLSFGRGWSSMVSIAGAGNWNNSGGGDLMALDSAGNLWLYPTDGHARIGSRTSIESGWSDEDKIVPATDRDGRAIYSIDGSGRLWRHTLVTQPAPRTVRTTVPMSAQDKRIIVPGDWDGDGKNDLIVHKSDGRLLLHRGSGGGRFASSGKQIGSGWNIFDQVVGAGGYFGNGTPVLLAYTRSSGRVVAYPADGTGGFGRPVTVGSGYTGYDALAATGVWDRSSRTPSFVMRGADSADLYLFPGGYDGPLGSRARIGFGWGAMDAIIGVDDASGDGHADLLAVHSSGRVYLYRGDGQGGFGTSSTLGSLPAGAAAAS